MKYFLIAGEASGDLHASNLVLALKEHDKEALFIGMGGDKMQQAGCRILQHYSNMAFMGVLAVLANLRKVRGNFKIAEQTLLQEQPDVLILVDYPSFNLRIAKFCRKNLPETRIVYYIPPKIWAWKTYRVHSIAKFCDLILGIFPFESSFYARYGYKCLYVGNPTMDSIRAWMSANISDVKEERRGETIALLPGSRRSEIKHCLPVMLAAARKVRQSLSENMPLTITVTAAPGIEDDFYYSLIGNDCMREQEITIRRDTYMVVSQAAAAVVNSGTATLETALLGCPQTAVYYVAFSRHLGFLKPLIFHIPFFTLVNIIPGKEVIQELVAHRFTQKEIENELIRLLTDHSYRRQMLDDYRQIEKILGTQSAARSAARYICADIDQTP